MKKNKIDCPCPDCQKIKNAKRDQLDLFLAGIIIVGFMIYIVAFA